MGSQRAGHDLVTEKQKQISYFITSNLSLLSWDINPASLQEVSQGRNEAINNPLKWWYKDYFKVYASELQMQKVILYELSLCLKQRFKETSATNPTAFTPEWSGMQLTLGIRTFQKNLCKQMSS